MLPRADPCSLVAWQLGVYLPLPATLRDKLISTEGQTKVAKLFAVGGFLFRAYPQRPADSQEAPHFFRGQLNPRRVNRLNFRRFSTSVRSRGLRS